MSDEKTKKRMNRDKRTQAKGDEKKKRTRKEKNWFEMQHQQKGRNELKRLTE